MSQTKTRAFLSLVAVAVSVTGCAVDLEDDDDTSDGIVLSTNLVGKCQPVVAEGNIEDEEGPLGRILRRR